MVRGAWRLGAGAEVLGAALAWALSTGPALAQPSTPARALAAPSPDSPAPRSRELGTLRGATPDRGFDELAAGFVDQGLFAGDYGGDGGSALVLTTDFGARLGIGRDARVRFDWGLAWSRSRVVGTFTSATMSEPYDFTIERTEARNADFALEWAPWIGSNARVLVGIGTAVPVAALATFGNGLNGGMATAEEAAILDASSTTHTIWFAMNGGWAPWRYQSDRIACFAPLGVFFDLGAVEMALEGALAVSFPVIGGTGGTEGAVTLATELSGTPLPELSLGARASVSIFSIGGRGEGAQPAVEPFVRLDVAPVSVTLRGVLNLGGGGSSSALRPPPYGLGGPNGVWAIHVGIALVADAEAPPGETPAE